MGRTAAMTALTGAWLGCVSMVDAAEIVYPSKDGTLVDGVPYGPFGGGADGEDWTFDDKPPDSAPPTIYEGWITLEKETIEHRVVWEYDLSTVTLAYPVSATLTFTIRGVSVEPFPDMNVHVYEYPADLQEGTGDFGAEPAVLQGGAIVVAGEVNEHSLDVSSAVREALRTGDDRVAFRFQIDPDTPHESNQAFIDADDGDPTTKPFLTIWEAAILPGDLEFDDDVDLEDHALFEGCFTGPVAQVTPGCEPADTHPDGHVDLRDFADILVAFTGPK